MSKERELLWRIQQVLQCERDDYGFVGEIENLLAQPDTITQYLLDQVSRLTAENAMLKEKWSQPKREPLSAETIAELWWNTYVVGTADSVRNFVRAIEKAHGNVFSDLGFDPIEAAELQANSNRIISKKLEGFE